MSYKFVVDNNYEVYVYMLPDLWGPYAWHLFHTVAYSALPDAQRTPYLNFFRTYETVMPCRECRYHFSEWVDENPLREIKVYSKWVNGLHNNVSSRLGKEIWSSDEVHDHYFKDGVLQVSHSKIFKWIDIMVREADLEHPQSNIYDFQDYIIFFNSLRDVFPCPVCREKLRELMELYPITEVSDAASLQEWYGKIREPWRRGHLYLGTNVYLVYRKVGSKKWFFRKVNMKGVKFVEKVGNDVMLTLDGNKKRKMELPVDVDTDNMTVATETDLEFTKKVLTEAT